MASFQLACQLATTTAPSYSIAFAATKHLQWKRLPQYSATAKATDPHRTTRK